MNTDERAFKTLAMTFVNRAQLLTQITPNDFAAIVLSDLDAAGIELFEAAPRQETSQ